MKGALIQSEPFFNVTKEDVIEYRTSIDSRTQVHPFFYQKRESRVISFFDEKIQLDHYDAALSRQFRFQWKNVFINSDMITKRRYECMSDAKPENKPDKWMSWVALSTAIMAVLAAVTTLYMGKYSSRAILHQGQETDQWAYYQAKSIKSYIYEIQKQKLELELMASGGKQPKAVLNRYNDLIRNYDKQIKRYDSEKEEIKTKAESLAKSKEEAQARAGNFGYALIFLQIAIMLSSISALTKKKPLFYVGLVTVTGWLFFFLDAVFLFY